MKIPIQTNGNKVIDSIVIAALLWATLNLQAEVKPRPKNDSFALACMGMVVAVVGGMVVYKLADFCNRNLPRTNTARMIFQGSSDMTNWTTVLDTNCYWQDFEYRAVPDGNCKFHRVMFP